MGTKKVVLSSYLNGTRKIVGSAIVEDVEGGVEIIGRITDPEIVKALRILPEWSLSKEGNGDFT